jgi:hypothetical protein
MCAQRDQQIAVTRRVRRRVARVWVRPLKGWRARGVGSGSGMIYRLYHDGAYQFSDRLGKRGGLFTAEDAEDAEKTRGEIPERGLHEHRAPFSPILPAFLCVLCALRGENEFC